MTLEQACMNLTLDLRLLCHMPNKLGEKAKGCTVNFQCSCDKRCSLGQTYPSLPPLLYPNSITPAIPLAPFSITITPLHLSLNILCATSLSLPLSLYCSFAPHFVLPIFLPVHKNLLLEPFPIFFISACALVAPIPPPDPPAPNPLPLITVSCCRSCPSLDAALAHLQPV